MVKKEEKKKKEKDTKFTITDLSILFGSIHKNCMENTNKTKEERIKNDGMMMRRDRSIDHWWIDEAEKRKKYQRALQFSLDSLYDQYLLSRFGFIRIIICSIIEKLNIDTIDMIDLDKSTKNGMNQYQSRTMDN